jgi:hypothetical protein
MPLFPEPGGVGLDERLIYFQSLRNGGTVRRAFVCIRQGYNDHPFGAIDAKGSRPELAAFRPR